MTGQQSEPPFLPEMKARLVAAARELSEPARLDFLDLVDQLDDEDLLMALSAALMAEGIEDENVLRQYGILE